jgi:predicted DNA-binding transcriptional regulator AlpA
MATYSTVEVAEIVGVSWDTLNRWIREKKFPVPPVKSLGRFKVRLWTEAEIDRVRGYKKDHYRGKGSRKPRNRRSEKK